MRTKHHRLFLLLALVMLAGVISAALPLMAGAAIDPSFDGDYWHEYGSECGYSDIQFDPNIITIHSEEDFAKLAYELFYDGMIFDGDPATVILATDLDLGELLWFPVNLDNVRFEGNDHTISNLRVEDLELTGEGWVDAYEFGYAGLFGQLSNSAVLDLTFVDPYISIDMEWWHDSDTTYLGVVAGAAKSSQIREVYIYDPLVRLGDYDGGGGIGNAFVGGVTGYSSDCTIINGAEVFGGEVVIDATRISTDAACFYFGGIAGASYSSIIANGAVYDTLISASDIDTILPFTLLNAGGIVGYTSAVEQPYVGYICVMNSVSTARFDVPEANTMDGWYVGGIAGVVNQDNAVNNVYLDTGENTGDFIMLFGDVSEGDFTVNYNYHVFDERTECYLVSGRDDVIDEFPYSEIIDRLNGAGFDLAIQLTAANMGQSEEWVIANGILKTWVFLPESPYYAEDTPGFGDWEEPVDVTYTVTVVNGTGSGDYKAGAVVTITANPAPAGQVFAGWVSSDGVVFADASASTTTFVMPTRNVTVTATYKDAGPVGPDPVNPAIPDTGDTTQVVGWLALALASVTVVTLACYGRDRKRFTL